MRIWIALALGLVVVPASSWGQNSQPEPDRRGELVLAHTTYSFNFGKEGPKSSTLNVWQSGFVELSQGTGIFFRGSNDDAEAMIVQSSLRQETISRLRTNLVEAGILGLEGAIQDGDPSLPQGLSSQRVTFVERAPSWLHRLFDRYPGLRKRWGVYLRPRVASFSLSGQVMPDPTAREVVAVIQRFTTATFPGATPPPGESIPFESILKTSVAFVFDGPQDFVIRDENEWCAFWDRLNSQRLTEPPPCNRNLVDFSREVVFATATGTLSSNCGDSIEVTDVRVDESRDAVQVFVQQRKPRCACGLTIIGPVDVVKVNGPIGDVEFVRQFGPICGF